MKYRARVLEREIAIDIHAAPPDGTLEAAFDVSTDGRPPVALYARLEGDALLLRLDGRLWRAVLSPAPPGAQASAATVHGETLAVELEAGGALSPQGAPSKAVGPVRVTSTMPGRVVAVRVAVGDLVERGDLLLTLEAMKMQNEFVAPAPGRVLKLHAQAGQVAAAGDVLVEIEPAPGRL